MHLSQGIKLNQDIEYRYQSDSEQYSTVSQPIQDYDLTIVGKYQSNKLNILTRMGYHLIDGMIERPSDFTHEQGLYWFDNPPGIGYYQRNYYIADMKPKADKATIIKIINGKKPNFFIRG